MPRSRKPSQSEPIQSEPQHASQLQPFVCPDDAKWGGFLNCRLDDEQVEDFHEWLPNAQKEAGWEMFHNALREGLKFSLTYDVGNNTFIATFTGDLLHVGDRRAVTSRAPLWAQAVMLAVYKHFVVLAADYSSLATEKPKWNTFG